MPRIILQPVGIGFDYAHGGFDMFFVGNDATPDPTYRMWFTPEGYPPSPNFYWIEDGPATPGTFAGPFENVTALWDAIYAEPDASERATLLKEFQAWAYEEVPCSIIRQEIQIFGMHPDVEGFDSLLGFEEGIQNVTMGGATAAVIAQPGDYVDFNPSQSNSYYDAIIWDNVYVELARRRGEYNITHAAPWLASGWVHSEDYLQWNVTLRQGVKWSDGTDVTADDVVFTYKAYMHPDTASPQRGNLENILGTDVDAAIVKLGDYEVQFNLPKFYPYVETDLFGGRQDILQKAQMELVPFANWKTDITNTGLTGIGAGAYMYDAGASSLPDSVVLVPNPHYDPAAIGHDPLMEGG
ncbi:MAG: hypothetical protein JSV04_09470, partial [Candidatus Heimdallarchaeota archaeon]